MEIIAANVAQHKIFGRKPSFIDKKMDEKSSFGGLSTEEIQEIVDNTVPLTTEKPTNFGMRQFNATYKLRFPSDLRNFKYDLREFTHA